MAESDLWTPPRVRLHEDYVRTLFRLDHSRIRHSYRVDGLNDADQREEALLEAVRFVREQREEYLAWVSA